MTATAGRRDQSGRRDPSGRRRRRHGQSLVEFAILLPAFLIVLFGMLEFGFAFSHHLTLEYATREGARVGAALASGTKAAPCDQTKAENVDELIIAAVQRVITSPGSQVPAAQVAEIHIYKATSDGSEPANPAEVNVWVPDTSGTLVVDGTALVFKPSSQPWGACGRKKSLTFAGPPDSIGVSLIYDYQAMTPLGAILKISGAGTLRISDRTIMALNPFQEG